MRVGLFMPSVSPFATPDYITAYAQAAEEHGFSSIWVGEHVVFFDEYESSYPYSDDGKVGLPADSGLLDEFATLTHVAAVTEKIRIGTAICLVPQRNPVYTAKEVSTVDWLSKGRVDFGIGIGWLREEFEALNTPFEQRAARTRDYIEVMRSLWRDDVSSFKGEYYTLPSCRMFPKPVQDGGPPIYFGGESEPALRRVAEIGDGWHGFNHLPESAAAAVTTLEPMLKNAGRSLDDIDITVCPYMQPVEPSHLTGYRDAGVNQLVLTGFAMDPAQAREVIGQLGDAYVGPAADL